MSLGRPSRRLLRSLLRVRLAIVQRFFADERELTADLRLGSGGRR